MIYRHPARPRDGWRRTVESQGLLFPMTDTPDGSQVPYWNESAFYEFDLASIEQWEMDTEELYRMCLRAAEHMLTRYSDDDLGLPEGSVALARESYERRDPSIYARFDFAVDQATGDIKMLELNGDTPTGLVETGVAQWNWLEDVFPDGDQWNSLHDRLVMWWRENTFPGNEVHFFFSSADEFREEEMTVTYLRDTAVSAGVSTYGHILEQLAYHSPESPFAELRNGFADNQGKRVRTAFKLYPWESMLEEEFGRVILRRQEDRPVQWIEPAWKLMLSTKALLPVLWELYPGHKNLLPSFFDGPGDLDEWVSKPLHGREGDNVRVHTLGAPELVKPGKYDRERLVYQQYVPLPSFDGNQLVLGSWVVGGKAAGMLCRESDGPVTDFYSRVCPHVLGSAVRPDVATQQAWLRE